MDAPVAGRTWSFPLRALLALCCLACLSPLFSPLPACHARKLEGPSNLGPMQRLLLHVLPPVLRQRFQDSVGTADPQEFVALRDELLQLKHEQQQQQEQQQQERQKDDPSGSTAYGTSSSSFYAFAPAPSPSQPPPPPPATCPPTPSQCDFFFQNYSTSLPSFPLSSKADTPISPPILTSVGGSDYSVYVFNTQRAEYICNTTTPAPPPNDQFYSNGVYLQMRTLQSGAAAMYPGQYVRLNITSVQISVNGRSTNINPGELTNLFPEDRRCIVFQVSA